MLQKGYMWRKWISNRDNAIKSTCIGICSHDHLQVCRETLFRTWRLSWDSRPEKFFRPLDTLGYREMVIFISIASSEHFKMSQSNLYPPYPLGSLGAPEHLNDCKNFNVLVHDCTIYNFYSLWVDLISYPHISFHPWSELKRILNSLRGVAAVSGKLPKS